MTNITPTTPPPEGNIDTQVIGHVLLIGINRPAKRNGWTPPRCTGYVILTRRRLKMRWRWAICFRAGSTACTGA